MTKKMITVPVGADVKVHKRTDTYFGNLQYPYRETVDIKYSSLDAAIESLEEIRQRYKDEYTDMSFDTIQDCGCHGECSCAPTMFVTGERLENDAEYEFRLSEEQHHKELQNERDRLEYDRLKKKLGES